MVANDPSLFKKKGWSKIIATELRKSLNCDTAKFKEDIAEYIATICSTDAVITTNNFDDTPTVNISTTTPTITTTTTTIDTKASATTGTHKTTIATSPTNVLGAVNNSTTAIPLLTNDSPTNVAINSIANNTTTAKTKVNLNACLDTITTDSTDAFDYEDLETVYC